MKYARTMGVQACCSGPFAYTKDSITLEAIFLGVVKAELSGTFYEMATKDDNRTRARRRGPIGSIMTFERWSLRGRSVDICILFCWTIVSGNLFMVP